MINSFLEQAEFIPGVYGPSLFQFIENEQGSMVAGSPFKLNYSIIEAVASRTTRKPGIRARNRALASFLILLWNVLNRTTPLTASDGVRFSDNPLTNISRVEIEQRIYTLSDEDRLKRETFESRKALLKAVTEQLEKLEQKPGTYYLGNRDAELKELKQIPPALVAAFPIIGAEGIQEANYNERRIKAKVDKALLDQILNSIEFSEDLDTKFKIGDKPIEMYIVTTLQDLYDRHGIKLAAKAAHIQKFFDADRTSQGTGDNKVYHIKGPLKSTDSPPIDCVLANSHYPESM